MGQGRPSAQSHREESRLPGRARGIAGKMGDTRSPPRSRPGCARRFTAREYPGPRRIDPVGRLRRHVGDRKSTRLNSSHGYISYAVFCLKKKKKNVTDREEVTDTKSKRVDYAMMHHSQ